MDADEVWISSSTREVVPITLIDDSPVNNGKVGKIWSSIYDRYQSIKSINVWLTKRPLLNIKITYNNQEKLIGIIKSSKIWL